MSCEYKKKYNITSLIKRLCFHYVKHHYNNHLEENKINFIEHNELVSFVDNIYFEKKKNLCSYIRACLKETLNENYNSLIIEQILLEMFDDDDFAKNRVVLEIEKYQKDNTYSPE